MPDDRPSSLEPIPSGRRPPGEPGAESDRELIARLRDELRSKDRELNQLRGELRAIHTSDAWAMLRTAGQLRYALAPHGTRRDRMARRLVRGLRLLKKLAAGLSRATGEAARGRRAESGGAGAARIDPATRDNPAIICLPMIEWHFRFQRPQQLMRQFARSNHLVLYAANRFHRGPSARVRPIEDNVLEIMLPGDPAANVYQSLPTEHDCARMLEAVERLAAERGLADAIVVAQHPYWMATAEALRRRFGWTLVYDCMDDHAGFLHNGPEILENERRLVATADLVVASSDLLFDNIRRRARSSALIRNACEYEHFHRAAGDRSTGGPVRVGYYGAIAEWFDSELVARLAALRPDWRFELIGSTLAGNIRPLVEAATIRLLGECPYADLPERISGWDAFIIPFQRTPLTEATNPVKVYEMLATGRPVVAVGLPELVPIAEAGLIRLAATAEEFAAAIEQELRDDDEASSDRRREFARRNTWPARHRELADAIDAVRLRHGAEKPHGLAGPHRSAALRAPVERDAAGIQRNDEETI